LKLLPETTILPFPKRFVQVFHSQGCIIATPFKAKPGYDMGCLTVYLSHYGNLMMLFLAIRLIDCDGVDPETRRVFVE
jgi:hypothetical protein